MEKIDIHKKIDQALEAFERISYLSPTDEWNDTLLSRLKATQKRKRLRSSHVLFIIFIALILGGNVVFGLKMLSNEGGSSEQANRLQAISNEFLINPVSAKN